MKILEAELWRCSKMASETLDFSGFPESTVEMRDARDRAFTQYNAYATKSSIDM